MSVSLAAPSSFNIINQQDMTTTSIMMKRHSIAQILIATALLLITASSCKKRISIRTATTAINPRPT